MTSVDHKNGLITMYKSFIHDENCHNFQKLLFEKAIFLLNAGHKPVKVENWVVKMENNWTYF